MWTAAVQGSNAVTIVAVYRHKGGNSFITEALAVTLIFKALLPFQAILLTLRLCVGVGCVDG